MNGNKLSQDAEMVRDQKILDTYFTEQSGLYYIELSRLAQLPFADLPPECLGTFQAVEHWISTYLTQPHPDLGRDGAVCPFVKACVVKKQFYLTAIYDESLEAAGLATTLDRWRELFLKLEPTNTRNSIYRTLLILLPESSDAGAQDLFVKALELRKSQFVKEGLMLGEFHGGPPEKFGLHNSSFKPLYSPVPLLAIREMVRSDLPFLKADPVHLECYMRKFSNAQL